MDKLASLWSFVRKHKYLITLALFAVIIGFLDENSVVRRLGYAREESRLRDEIEKYRKEYEENTERLNELAVDSGAIERIAREKYLMKIKKNETTDTRPFRSRGRDALGRSCRLYHGLASFTLYIYYRRYDGCFGPN